MLQFGVRTLSQCNRNLKKPSEERRAARIDIFVLHVSHMGHMIWVFEMGV